MTDKEYITITTGLIEKKKEYITITVGLTPKYELKFKPGSYCGDKSDTTFDNWCGEYTPITPQTKKLGRARTICLCGSGMELRGWTWLILHETLHDLFCMEFKDEMSFRTEEGIDFQEYIIDKVLGDLGYEL